MRMIYQLLLLILYSLGLVFVGGALVFLGEVPPKIQVIEEDNSTYFSVSGCCGSMRPTIFEGDRVQMKKLSENDFVGVKDVVSYVNPNNRSKRIRHRIVGRLEGGCYEGGFLLMGDANDLLDNDKGFVRIINRSDIKSVVVGVFPQ